MRVSAEYGKPEVFLTIQGEGPSAGRQATFVRLSGCNLTCSWCDTPYTWDWKQFDKRVESVEMSCDAVARLINDLGSQRVVFTGGEPMLQQRALVEVIRQTSLNFVEVETNGTIKPTAELDELVTQYNCSPKLRNSGVAEDKRTTEALEWFAQNPKTAFKFVTSNQNDVAEIKTLATRFGMTNIWLMPEGETREAQIKAMPAIMDFALENGWNFTARLHVLVWDKKRGV